MVGTARPSWRIASGAIPTPPPTSIARRPCDGAVKPVPSGPSTHSPSPACSSHSRRRAGTDVLEQEVRLAAAAAGDREGARQVRTLVVAPAPALGCGEHRELPGPRLGTVGIGDAQHAVGAELVHAADGQQLGGRSRRARSRHPGPVGALRRARGLGALMPCSSCRHSTSGSPSRRALAIARAAETPADERRQAGDAVRHGRAADLAAVGRARRTRSACSRRGRRRRARSSRARAASPRRSCSAAPPARPCARSPRRCRAWRRSESRCRAGSGRPRRRRPCRSR